MQRPRVATRRLTILALVVGALLTVGLVYGPAAAQQSDGIAEQLAVPIQPEDGSLHSLILHGGPQPYLGFGKGRNPFTQNVPQLPDDPSGGAPERFEYPNTVNQNYWLSMNWSGTDKNLGDPFTAKYNCAANGGLCNNPPNDQYPRSPSDYQVDYDNEGIGQGYNFAITEPLSGSAQLRVFDAAFAVNPGTFDSSWVPRLAGPQRYNDRTTWCQSNTPFTGDNIAHQELLAQVAQNEQVTILVTSTPAPFGTPRPVPLSVNRCRPGAENMYNPGAEQLTTTYTLYYPDGTPNYFGDDIMVPNSRWDVGPVAYRSTTSDSVSANDYSRYDDPDDEPYHNKWVNYNTQPNGTRQGVQPYAGTAAGGFLNRITLNNDQPWRLNVNVQRDPAYQNGRRVDVPGQNNFSLLLDTPSGPAGQINTLDALPVYVSLSAGVTDLPLAYLGSEYAGQAVDVRLFDIGDVSANSCVIQLVRPDGMVQGNLTVVVSPQEDRSNQQPVTFGPTDHYLAKSNGTQYGQNRWVDLVYTLPADYPGGWWKLRYITDGAGNERTTWRVYSQVPTPSPTPGSGKPTNR